MEDEAPDRIADLEEQVRSLEAALDAMRSSLTTVAGSAGSLENRIAEMQGTVDQVANDASNRRHPLQPIFIAEVNGVQWQEQAINRGNVETFIAGRHVDDNSNPGALVGLPNDSFVLIEFPDKDSAGRDVFRYVKVGGGTETKGTRQDQVHKMVTDNEDGWDWETVSSQ